MRAAGLSDAAVDAFRHNFDALAGGETGLVRERGGGQRKAGGRAPAQPNVWCRARADTRPHHPLFPLAPPSTQMPEADIKPVDALPTLEELAAVPPTPEELKVRGRRGERGVTDTAKRGGR